jgi:hypothetical protein
MQLIINCGVGAVVARMCGVGVMDTPIRISALRAVRYSTGDKELIIGLTTQYSGAERQYIIPVECFYDLITDLQRLGAASEAASFEISVAAE